MSRAQDQKTGFPPEFIRVPRRTGIDKREKDAEELGSAPTIIAEIPLREIMGALKVLNERWLEYLTLGRKAGTLFRRRGATHSLASQIGSRWWVQLYILDEPTIGLHQR